MVPGDVVIFLSDSGEAISFVRGETIWNTGGPGGISGYPTDEDISKIKESGRKWIHIRGEYIVGVNLHSKEWWRRCG